MMKAFVSYMAAWGAPSAATMILETANECWAHGRVGACIACWVLAILLGILFRFALAEYAKASAANRAEAEEEEGK